jgi:hypothetical protein
VGISFGKAFEVLPELGMLFDELLLRHGEPVAKQEVLERILVEDVVHVERIAAHVKIEPEFAGAKAIKGFAVPLESTEGLAGMLEVGGPDIADGLNHSELNQRFEFVQLPHGLL